MITEAPEPNSLRVTAESIASGRCANCFQPIYRDMRSKGYLHRHNGNVGCARIEDELKVRDISVHSGDTNDIALLKCVKTIHKLVTAHNKLVDYIREHLDTRKVTPITPPERNFIGMPKPDPFEIPSEAKEVMKMTDQTFKEMSMLDKKALMIQLRYICRCVAPVPILVTGPGHVEFCAYCHRLIVEEDHD